MHCLFFQLTFSPSLSWHLSFQPLLSFWGSFGWLPIIKRVSVDEVCWHTGGISAGAWAGIPRSGGSSNVQGFPLPCRILFQPPVWDGSWGFRVGVQWDGPAVSPWILLLPVLGGLSLAGVLQPASVGSSLSWVPGPPSSCAWQGGVWRSYWLANPPCQPSVTAAPAGDKNLCLTSLPHAGAGPFWQAPTQQSALSPSDLLGF